mgnify:FL=1
MTLVDNYQLRTAIVSMCKDIAAIPATLIDTDEIRELDWMGEKFSYPNIRITCSITALGQCAPYDAVATISYFSEQKSSKQAIQSQGIIAKQLHNVNKTYNSVKMTTIRVTSLPDAVQVAEDVWKADVPLSMKVNEVS